MTIPFSFPGPAGSPEAAALAVPAGEAKVGALLVVHEWWGLNDGIREQCDRFAEAGYLALGVDLYGGRSTTDAGEAMQLSNDMKTSEAMKVVEAAAKALREHPRCNGKVGITGFCLGGGMSLAAACTVPGIACAVPFYGLPRAEFQTFGPATPPILGHYALVDAFVTPERTRAAHAAAIAAGARFELHFYEAGHAFMRRGDAEAFDAKAAELAWSRTLAFLAEHLGA